MLFLRMSTSHFGKRPNRSTCYTSHWGWSGPRTHWMKSS